MSGSVLLSASEIEQARLVLDQRSLSSITTHSFVDRLLSRIGLHRGVAVGDRRKSWDILKTIHFLEQRCSPEHAHILDLGAFASELPPILHRLGYRHVTAVDLNPSVRLMPHQESVRYLVCDFLQSPLDDRSIDAITSISVIEHGFQPDRLLAEVSRLLRPGGYFVASFDYWPNKIATSGTTLFGMSWRIFSRDEVLEFVGLAATFGLTPLSDLTLDAAETVIHWNAFDYTFAWVALQKQVEASAP